MTLLLAVLVASLLGSLHCAGMCGAFVAIACNDADRSVRAETLRQIAYHGGRLLSYTSLGLAAGAVGKLMNLTVALSGVKNVAAIIAGVTLVLFGLIMLMRTTGFSGGRFRLPRWWNQLMQRGHRAAMNRPPLLRALLIGLLTTLLPCGWLYMFVVWAAGTGSALQGGLLMAAFWLGTVPILAALGIGTQRVLGPLARKLPAITAVLLILIGVYTVSGRAMMDVEKLARRAENRGAPTTQPATAPAPCCSHDRK